jgi:hypothetical protein
MYVFPFKDMYINQNNAQHAHGGEEKGAGREIERVTKKKKRFQSSAFVSYQNTFNCVRSRDSNILLIHKECFHLLCNDAA